jgi:hypothetical protein
VMHAQVGKSKKLNNAQGNITFNTEKIVYEWNMLINDKIILPLLCKDNHMQETKHENVKVRAHYG